MPISTESELRERLRKIRALFEGAQTPGERLAAAAAMERIEKTLGSAAAGTGAAGTAASTPPNFSGRSTFTQSTQQQGERPIEMQINLPDRWQRRLLVALCRRYGVQPFRYKRQRYTTVMVRAKRSLFEGQIWPEYLELRDALNEYLEQATERIIREEVFGETGEASEQAG